MKRTKFGRRNIAFYLAAMIAIAPQVGAVGQSRTDADWAQWWGPNRDGISAESDWLAQWPMEGPTVIWEASIGVGYSAVSVSDGRAYTMGSEGANDRVFCFDAVSGEEKWRFEYACKQYGQYHKGGPSSTPLIDGDSVYTLSEDGDLHCLNANTGKKLWWRNLREELKLEAPTFGYCTSPMIEGGRLIVDVGVVLALDKAGGETIWQSKAYHPSYASPVAFTHDGKRRLAVFNGNGLVVLDAETGAEIAQHEWYHEYRVNAAQPIIHGDEIFITTGYGKGCSLLKFDGAKLEPQWTNKNMRSQFWSSVLWKGHIYGFDNDRLRCLDWETGEAEWTDETPDYVKGSSVLADGKLIILSESGEMIVGEPSPEGFREISQAHPMSGTCWTMPVLSNGRIYCRNEAGRLICLDVGAKAADEENP